MLIRVMHGAALSQNRSQGFTDPSAIPVLKGPDILGRKNADMIAIGKNFRMGRP
jgi:hypothetical protein